MRPTIPLALWRIAVDLAATQSVQNQPGLPAFGCSCQWCNHWKGVWSSVFPVDVREQLERLCIDVAHPSDVYVSDEIPAGVYCRVIYHLVGRLLSGPPAWREQGRLGKILVYHALNGAPVDLGLVVVPSSQTGDAEPQVRDAAARDLLQIDFRLFVPRAEALPK